MKKLIIIAAILLLSASCMLLPVEEPVLPPPILHGAAVTTFRTIEVRRGDVVLFIDITAHYVPAQEETIGFSVGDEVVKTVYVDVGDIVEAGDILAELDRTYFQNELEKLARDEAWLRLNLAHLEERHNLRLAEARANDTLAEVSAYLDERDVLLNRLNALEIQKNYLLYQDSRRVLRAGISGMVVTALAFQEGLMSTADRGVFTIADQTQSIFMVRGSGANNLVMGEQYDININGELFAAEVVDPALHNIHRETDAEVYLVLVGGEPPDMTGRLSASIHMVLEERNDVLMIPFSAIRQANARIFVYILDDGVRVLRDIEIGLIGNHFTEIISGLSEGDEVIQG